VCWVGRRGGVGGVVLVVPWWGLSVVEPGGDVCVDGERLVLVEVDAVLGGCGFGVGVLFGEGSVEGVLCFGEDDFGVVVGDGEGAGWFHGGEFTGLWGVCQIQVYA